jgi:hypothetical protein
VQHAHLEDRVIAVLGQQRLLVIAALAEAKARRHFDVLGGVRCESSANSLNGRRTSRQLPNACSRS